MRLLRQQGLQSGTDQGLSNQFVFEFKDGEPFLQTSSDKNEDLTGFIEENEDHDIVQNYFEIEKLEGEFNKYLIYFIRTILKNLIIVLTFVNVA